MHVVASKPAAPARNPARDSYAGLGGRTVRLEAPDELPGSWDGPVYSTLIGDPQHRAADDSPFFDDADGRKRPAWQVTLTFLLPGQRSEDIESALRVHVDVPYWIPHWRLTQPSRNLATELLERPLLSVFRFLRFTEFFVATPHQDTKFTRHTSDVFLCGQVLDYRPATSMALVDDIDLIQEPGCSYICMVGIRGYRAERHQVVAIPLIDVRSQVISQEEFVMGFYHGLPATLQPPRFAAAWQSFCSSPADSASVRVQLGQAFPAPGAALHDVLDLGSQAVSYVTPRGTKRAEIPVDYAWRMAHPPLATMDFDEAGALPDATLSHRSPDADLPLLTRAEAELTPGDQIAPALLAAHPLAPGVHLPGPPASTRPPTSGSGPAVPPPASAPGLTGEALMQALLLEQRATNNALRSQLQVLSEPVVSIQHRLAVHTPGSTSGPSSRARADLNSASVSGPARGEGERGLTRLDATVSPLLLRHGPGPTHRGTATSDRRLRSRSPVRRPSRSRSHRHDRRARSHLHHLVAPHGLAPGAVLVVAPDPPGGAGALHHRLNRPRGTFRRATTCFDHRRMR